MKNKKFSMIASVLVLSALSFSCLAGCSNEEEPYTFTNPPKVVAEADADMTFDGEFKRTAIRRYPLYDFLRRKGYLFRNAGGGDRNEYLRKSCKRFV